MFNLNEPIKTYELIKSANQSNQQLKGTRVIEAAKIIAILMKAKKKVVCSKSKEAINVMF